MSEQHTPGPWVIEQTIGGRAEISSVEGRWWDLARVVVAVEGSPSKEGLANANLIAAAPELLAALENIMPYIEGDTKAPWKPALAVIAKAKGGRP